jgi:DNA-directed RNA polymerase subunit D
MDVLTKTDEKLVLRIDANETLANAIRRSVNEIPVLAIDEVEIFKNDSALYDEVLAHRLGLVPLKTEKSMNGKTKVEFKLVKEGPCTVYSQDLEGPAEVIYPKIPITLLGEGSKIELVATAILGKGIEHAKFIPGLAYYRHILEITSAPKIDSIIQGSKGVLKGEKKGSKWLCDLTEAEIKAVEEVDPQAISNSSEMLFFIESYGNLPAKDIFLKSIESLGENLDLFEKELK